MRFYAMVALLAAPAHPLAQRRLLGATKKKAVAKIKAQQEQLTAQAATIEQQKATIDALREELAAAQAAAASSPSEDSSEASENFVKVKRTAPPEVPEWEAAVVASLQRTVEVLRIGLEGAARP